MSFLPGEPLRYAETHFKFKLPWSLLYKPWPEILLDAPFQFVPGTKPMLWIVVRDAHRFPTLIENIELSIELCESHGGADSCTCGESKSCEGLDAMCSQTRRTIELQIKATEQFAFYPVELGELPPGKYTIHGSITASRIVGMGTSAKVKFTRWNYPRLKASPLKIQVLAEDLPKPEGYAAGEMHCHTHYSADHVEHGATPEVLQQAAAAVGLDFVSCTDHAYDFAYTTEDYTKEAESPLPRFEALRREVEICNSRRIQGNCSKNENCCSGTSHSSNIVVEEYSKKGQGESTTDAAAYPTAKLLPLMIAGEEVSAGNRKSENVHMTVLGGECYLPGLGDCGRNWLNNRPTFKISKLLQMTEAHCFAAHPQQQMGFLEKFIFRRGYWESKDLQSGSKHPIRGIQFWNGLRDEGFLLGREWWIEELGKENFVLPIGGNDAHGDLNDTTAVSLPLLTLKHNRHHVFGKVRTVVKVENIAESCSGSWEQKTTAADCGRVLTREATAEGCGGSWIQKQKTTAAGCENLTLDRLNAAFSKDNCYITDGPALWWERESAQGKQAEETRCKSITFHARSNAELGGGFRFIRIYGRRRLSNGKLAPKEELHLASLVAARSAEDICVPFDNFGYLRAECETATGKFALTSAAVNYSR